MARWFLGPPAWKDLEAVLSDRPAELVSPPIVVEHTGKQVGDPYRPARHVEYAELHAHSHFSFLDGASSPEDMVEQAARLGLARAILRRPRVLICDEVTAHLDGATAQQIDALLTALSGVLLLNVSHKISEAAAGRYDEVLRLENGRLVESGPPPARNRRQGAG